MTKQDKIKEAYGGLIDLNLLDENGWAIYGCEDFSESGIEPFGEYETKNHIAGVYNWRPKSLKGIENNNGWIKIESENNLPKQTNNLWLLANDGSLILGKWCIFQKIFKTTSGNNFDTDGVFFTHYQPIIKPDLPLY